MAKLILLVIYLDEDTTRQRWEETAHSTLEAFNKMNENLKDYEIRTIAIPGDKTKVECIYPYTESEECKNFMKFADDIIKEKTEHPYKRYLKYFIRPIKASRIWKSKTE